MSNNSFWKDDSKGEIQFCDDITLLPMFNFLFFNSVKNRLQTLVCLNQFAQLFYQLCFTRKNFEELLGEPMILFSKVLIPAETFKTFRAWEDISLLLFI